MIFSTIKIGCLEDSNRIVVAPMCQYQLGFSAVGLIMVESTAVEKIRRITHNCGGIYNENCTQSLKKIFS